VTAYWGGKRHGAGRPQVNRRKSEPHRARAKLARTAPVHVTVRTTAAVGALRRHRGYRAFHRALRRVAARADFRVVHLSIQNAHVHFLVEADDERALACGMQALQISAARALNAELGRRGNVFVDRYHPRVIASPRQARSALAYILNNWRKHGTDRAHPSWRVDPYSSAVSFYDDAPSYPVLPVCRAQTWLLRIGWARHGPIAPSFVPRSA
jgi:REP element-mobilizing transposase RayT